MFTYTFQCLDCGNEFTADRKYPISSTNDHPKYCPHCRPKYGGKGSKGSYKGRGDCYITSDGYVNIRVNGVMVAEHRYVMEQILGRPLTKGECVHHKGVRYNDIRNRADNLRDNLELWVKPHSINGQRASDLICPHCGKSYCSSYRSSLNLP